MGVQVRVLPALGLAPAGGEIGRRTINRLAASCLVAITSLGAVARPYFALLMPRSRVRVPPPIASAIDVAQLVRAGYGGRALVAPN